MFLYAGCQARHMPEFYVLEGIDGVGKSSTGEELADRLDAEYIQSPPDEFDDLRPIANSDETSTEFKYLTYMAGNALVADRVEEHLEAGRDVVVDRYIPSTIAYHNGVSDRDFADWADPDAFPEPDAYIYLEVDEETRLERVGGRDPDEGHAMEDDDSIMRSIEAEYAALAEEYEFHSFESTGGVGSVVDAIMDEVVEG